MKSKAFKAALAAVEAGDTAEEMMAKPDAAGMLRCEAVADVPEKTKDAKWMNYVYSNEPTITDNELISICALITYVAHMTERDEFRIERQFADRFNIPNVKCLPEDRYDDAVRYLVDQVPMFGARA